MQNPLFPSSTPDPSNIPDYLRTSSTTPQASSPAMGEDRNEAVDLIRQKLNAIYAGEGNIPATADAAPAPAPAVSKHQEFMRRLQNSGRNPAEIQAAWHDYYTELPDAEKHEVWQEFYAANKSAAPQQVSAPAPVNPSQPMPYQAQAMQPSPTYPAYQQPQPAGPRVIPADFTPVAQSSEPSEDTEEQTPKDIKQQILDKVTAHGKLGLKSHLHSLGFGLATGAVVVFIFLFGFFNEVFITPFIQPSRHAIETPVIVNTADAPASNKSEVIIPKINVEIPTDFSVTTTSEAAIETALNDGVVHYPTTVLPGQAGNSAFFGHSSNNIFNPGKYKFAFVLLHKLTEGDTFYLTYQGKTYTYEVISHQIVPPTAVGVLGPVKGQTATATLITCDPPGTSINRLVVVGKQISPDPSGNAKPANPDNSILATTEPSTKLPGNGPTLWSRMWHSIF